MQLQLMLVVLVLLMGMQLAGGLDLAKLW